jgi:hypothetical protein
MGKRINGAEPGTWDSLGIPHSQGPPSSSGFTRCSGIPVTQAFSEKASARERSLERTVICSHLTSLCLTPLGNVIGVANRYPGTRPWSLRSWLGALGSGGLPYTVSRAPASPPSHRSTVTAQEVAWVVVEQGDVRSRTGAHSQSQTGISIHPSGSFVSNRDVEQHACRATCLRHSPAVG